MPKITKLEPQKKKKGRINVYVDSIFSFGITETLVIDYDLYVGKEVSEKDIANYRMGETKQKCMEKSYALLAIRPRSEKEIRDKLTDKFEDNHIEECINKLKEYNYLNDEEFARKWVSERSKTKGRRALSYELRRKGVESNTIEDSLSEIDSEYELKTALRLVKSKKKYSGLTKQEAYKKVGNFLSGRGYTYDTVKKVIENLYM